MRAAAAFLLAVGCAPAGSGEETATGYVDGVAFEIVVVTVDQQPLELETAEAWNAMSAQADADDVVLRVVSGFRTMAEQERLYRCYVECNCNNCELAAPPGFSNHQSGGAVDVNTSEAGVYDWLDAHADDHGFARTEPSEEWHWERE
ncbi:MAG: M15 family metallopeptidase [Deltaproteobacteria bacterium]|nr:M15 family metallopeptidase [Deltaproteobacteria bacterium]